jgi:hypothetical protein
MGTALGPQPARYRQIHPGRPTARPRPVLEICQAEADWAQKEEERRSEIREERWKEVKKEAFVHVAYERNAKRLLLRDILVSRLAVTASLHVDGVADRLLGLRDDVSLA